MCKHKSDFGIANVKNILLWMENVVVFWQRWYNFQWNVFVTDVLKIKREYKRKDDLHPKCLQEVM